MGVAPNPTWVDMLLKIKKEVEEELKKDSGSPPQFFFCNDKDG